MSKWSNGSAVVEDESSKEELYGPENVEGKLLDIDGQWSFVKIDGMLKFGELRK